MIIDLPPEVGEKILDYCAVKDIVNLACCNRAHHNAVQHILWRAVRIPLQDFVSVPDTIFKNLRHTSSLCLLLSNDDSLDAEKSFSNGFNYMRLLNNICPEKLTNLNIKGMVAEEGFQYTMKELKFIKFLGLHSVWLNDWKSVCVAEKLEQLFLYDCNVNDEGIRVILEGIHLETLDVRSCGFMTNVSLEHISKARNLWGLTFRDNGSTRYDIKLIGELTNLIYLSLGGVYVKDAALLHLCQTLTSLESLTLVKLRKITDHGLSEIQLLEALEHLVIEDCAKITSKCFQHICSLNTLKELSFDTKICKVDFDNDELQETVSKLNGMRDLKEVIVHSRKNDDDKDLVCQILAYLCPGRKWALTVDPSVTNVCRYKLYKY